ncbi:FAD-binding domain-containing protein [Lophium mytilinum]|uniref:FAD-binding domain-containing protein n=1 Tax=Lophium mytilinum TaxID=390894 RepID=A0A6A6QKY7_9PEZI|nr:FAD-binding domain-containing protein [Lophium mytilinum]
MHVLVAFAAWLGLGSLPAPVSAHPLTPRAEDLKAACAALEPQLSNKAAIVYPHDPDWAELLVRGSSPRIYPNYNVVVEVGTEGDVQKTVQVAHEHGIPFLTVSGTHGWTKTLNNLPNGIQINMRRLNTTTVDAGGKTATVGGGTLQYEITRELFAHNKQAVTGLCECVSVIGPLMGGGHSMLQNQHGFSLDNIVSANVVLANGTALTASNTSHADLFWALRGAGHNFAVVTSMKLAIYDITSNWTVYSLIYDQSKLETLLPVINEQDSSPTRPAKLFFTGVWTRVPPIDAKYPIIAYTIGYEGNEAEAAQYVAPFKAVGPISTSVSTDVDYVALYTVTQNNLNSTACRANLNALGAGASLPVWNATVARKAFEVFTKMTADTRFNTSVMLMENYGMQGVTAVNPNSTSLSLDERVYPIVANPTIWWAGNDTRTNADAYAYGEQIRQTWFSGLAKDQTRHTYVNYANGVEGFEQMYGYEPWRTKKLKGLKGAWDPKKTFEYYNPVPAA